jgi:MFS family permease
VIPAQPFLRTRLSVYMAIAFAVNGAWMSALAKVLHDLQFTSLQINLVLGMGAVANLVSPLLAGQAVDRWISAGRFLAIVNVGTGLFLFLAWLRTDFLSLLGLTLGAQIFFVTTIPVIVSLVFRHLPDGPRQFPIVRAWGTVGWVMGAGALTGWLYIRPDRGLRDSLALAGGLAFLGAIFTLALPPTPPRRDAPRKFAVGQAVGMLKDPSFALFLGLMFLLQVGTTFYFTRSPIFLNHVGVSNRDLPAVVSIGQAVEVFMIFAMPRVNRRMGEKGMIALGLMAWIARYGIFALGAPVWLVIGSMALHGPCFAFGRIAPTMYVERIAPSDVKASAQSLLSLVMEGAGVLFGVALAAVASARTDWRTYWLIPGATILVVLILFLVGFRAKRVT